MDTSMIILLAMILVPIVLLLVLRINATLVFLSLCLGNVLAQFLADDTGWFVTMSANKVPQAGSVTDSMVRLALLLLPVILTAVFMIKTVRGRGKLALNVLPSAGVGLLGALLVVPLLTPGTAANITVSPLWQEIVKVQDLVVGASALLCLFVLWLQRPKTGHAAEKHSKHHSH